MKSETLFRSLLVLAAMSFLVGGCGVGSYQARNVDIKNATLVNPLFLFRETATRPSIGM